MPELVVKDATGQPKPLLTTSCRRCLLNELQKQQATIQAQNAKIETLVARLAAIEARLVAAAPSAKR